MMLGLVGALFVGGCATGGAASASSHDRSTRAAGLAAAPRQPDPGADALVRSIRGALANAGGLSRGAELRVSLDGIRNQSYAPAGEFNELRQRLADLLTLSGAKGRGKIRFVIISDEPVAYRLQGGAHVVQDRAGHRWELHLTMHPTGSSWVAWQPDAPVRMPRFPKPGEPQISLR
ncbi:MAG: hypothetical protein ACYSU7_11700 [Planctomycetota bacterium]|jgi:hypothetical protein